MSTLRFPWQLLPNASDPGFVILNPTIRRTLAIAILSALAWSCASFVGAVEIFFDYTYDELGFFDDPSRREVLETAADHVNRYVDSLSAITSSTGQSWQIFPALPPSGSNNFIPGPEVPADTVHIIVGGNDILPTLTLAETSLPGPIPTPEGGDWEQLVSHRGQLGALESPATDYGPWGGVIMFNSDEANWHFGLTTEGLNSEKTDLLTVVMHELMHIMGVGPVGPWTDHLAENGGTEFFVGQHSLAVGSENNPDLELFDTGHWARGTLSTIAGSPQPALMNPIVQPGTRKYPTALDRAAMRDVGWQEAWAGDSNLDGKFDHLDVVLVAQRDQYRSGQVASWADGDWNDDLRFDQRDLVTALAQGAYLTGNYAAMQPDAGVDDEQPVLLVYDAETGEVAISPPFGKELTSVHIESNSGIFTGSVADKLDGPFDVDTDESLFRATLASSFGALSFGAVSQPQLSEEFLLSDLSVEGSFEGGGFLGDVQLAYIPIPEPSSVILMFGLLTTWLVLGRRSLSETYRRAPNSC